MKTLGALLAAAVLSACAQRPAAQIQRQDPDALVADGRLYDAIVLLQEDPNYPDAPARAKKIEATLAREVGDRVYQANGLADKGRLAEAIRLYREAMKLDPRRSDLAEPVSRLNADLQAKRTNLFAVLDVQMKARNFADAHTTLLKLERLDPFNDDIGNKLNDVEAKLSAQYAKPLEDAVALYRKHEYSKALKILNNVLSMWPGHPQAANYRDRIKELYAEASKVGPARKKPATSASKAPVETKSEEPVNVSVSQITTLRLQEGQVYLQRGDAVKALERFNKTLDLEPGNQEAIKGRQQAIAKIGKSTEDIFREGVNFYRNEQLDKAIERWNLVLLIDPTHDRAQKYLERAQRLLDKFKEVTTPGGAG